MMPDPLPAYRFIVTLDKADAYLPPAQAQRVAEAPAGEFQEAKGLGAELEVMVYPEGGVNDFVHQLPVRHSWNRIILQRGVVRDPLLWAWYQAGLTQSLGARRDGSIILLNPDGHRVMAWDFRAGIAAKWVGPELNAMESSLAVESLEIAHHGLSLAASTLNLGVAINTVVGLFD
jgi:phage tail-like protein